MFRRVGDVCFGAVVALLARPQDLKSVEVPFKVIKAEAASQFPLVAVAGVILFVSIVWIGLLRRRQTVVPEIRSVTVRGDGARRRWH